jgi:hypothetical protein
MPDLVYLKTTEALMGPMPEKLRQKATGEASRLFNRDGTLRDLNRKELSEMKGRTISLEVMQPFWVILVALI